MDPVIINQSFEMSEVKRLLSKFYKVRGLFLFMLLKAIFYSKSKCIAFESSL